MSIKAYEDFVNLANMYSLNGQQVAELFQGYLGNKVFTDDFVEYAQEQYKNFTRIILDEEMSTICDENGDIMAAVVEFDDSTTKVCLARDAYSFKGDDSAQVKFIKIMLQHFDDLYFDDTNRLWISRDGKNNLLDDFKFIVRNGERCLISASDSFFAYEML